jgi:RES domain-containing protein
LFKAIQSNYVDTWQDYTKTSSFKNGARWNHAGVAALYTSKNPQNAMLEVANYTPSPKMANMLYTLVVFQVPELSLYIIEPSELPKVWSHPSHKKSVKNTGTKHLNNADHHGIVVPSVATHTDIATHNLNVIRDSVYQNVVLNLANVDLNQIKILDKFKPVYSDAMFN